MEIIVPHEGTDFDGLAAMIAASKVYPGAKPVFPGHLSNQVKDFMALFKDQFRIYRPENIDQQQVERIILVDTKDPSRVGPFKNLIFDKEIGKIVYDHHVLDDNNFNFKYVDFTSQVGSTTTILVERIKEEEIPITATEATLFALGIYHDTGCLVYPTTTSLDAEMIAYLLKNGAKLNVVEKFVEQSLNEAQQEVLNILLEEVENEIINGLRVDIYSANLPEYLLGVNNIIHKLRDIREADLYFIVVEMEGRVLIVGRSDVESVHLGQFLKHFGGGGHSGAASAVVKGALLTEMKEKLRDMLEEYIRQPRLAKDIMTTPVKTVPPESTIRQVEEIMLRYGHSGLIVVDEKEGIQGVFSRRDLEKVKKHDLSHAPVKGYMTRKVVTIAPKAPISKVQKLMVTHDIGRLPVVNANGKLMGIITRSDLLKVLYGEEISVQPSYYGSSLVKVEPKYYNIQSHLAKFPPELFDLFCNIRDLSQALGVEPYLVGGFVRDLFLNNSNDDLDLVIEGDGIEFAKRLHQQLGGKLDIHSEFGTANLEFNGYTIDVATARVEYYEYPAALPQVKPGLLKQDLYRRDFTINTLAISLGKENFGWLVDFFCGREDLQKGIIRGLHSFTFIDDPTRILRGIKFAVRFDFTIDKETDLLIRQAIKHGVFKKLKGPRLWDELKQVLKEEKEVEIFQYLEQFGILKEIASGLELSEEQWDKLKLINRVVQLFENGHQIERWSLVLMVIFRDLSKESLEELIEDWNLSAKERFRLNFARDEAESIREQLSRKHLKPSDIYNLLESYEPEELMYLVLVGDSQLVLDRILDFYNHLSGIETQVTGKDIIDMGYSPGPVFKEVITRVKEAKINGLVTDREEELDLAQEYLKERVD